MMSTDEDGAAIVPGVIGDTVVKASVEADGGDPSTVEFVEAPFPNAHASILSGDADVDLDPLLGH